MTIVIDDNDDDGNEWFLWWHEVLSCHAPPRLGSSFANEGSISHHKYNDNDTDWLFLMVVLDDNDGDDYRKPNVLPCQQQSGVFCMTSR